ncbi:MAG: hypothetical protein JWM44_2668 [Bacilli bacterium]|nr:hypothetical protein [Bacilli bacterium]
MTNQQYGLFAINEIIRIADLIESVKTNGGYNLVDLDIALQEATKIKALAEDTRNYMGDLLRMDVA